MCKTLGFRWLIEVFCPASAFSTADSDEVRNPQRFTHVTVVRHTKKANARSSTFVFLPTLKANAKKPKELALSKPTTRQ
jgi:hypothetical protein